MASVASVMFTMSRVPLALTVVRVLVKVIPLRYQVMLGEGSPEAVQYRVSEALLMSAFVVKTSMSSGSWINLGGVPVT